MLGQNSSHREAYDRAVARAVAPLNVLCEYLLPFVKAGGYALCWKGPAVLDEMTDGEAAAKKLGGQAEAPVSLGEEGHVLVPIRKIETTLPQYPRKNGIPAKRPLKKDK
ncbi:MAG: class I SAM-dependent methyltransferase [Clostridia bacterium]|nr:class I SAM-dependent methyltransferase [Clostridia bacterium]